MMDGRESSECLGTWECSSKPHTSRPSTQIQPRETLTKSTVKRVIGLQIPFRRQVSLPSPSPPTLVLDIVWKHRVQAKPGAPGRWLLSCWMLCWGKALLYCHALRATAVVKG